MLEEEGTNLVLHGRGGLLVCPLQNRHLGAIKVIGLEDDVSRKLIGRNLELLSVILFLMVLYSRYVYLRCSIFVDVFSFRSTIIIYNCVSYYVVRRIYMSCDCCVTPVWWLSIRISLSEVIVSKSSRSVDNDDYK
ncbi:unnamed protein product [Cuscuta epithymum]|uniref:Uncharacterized protein n=1 Tax=Cuscuta epithymum TaxID=186058 RepID=A0AAV0GG55_9ASTE|nr:unnamed protein product [Cuscuta epithymum]